MANVTVPMDAASGGGGGEMGGAMAFPPSGSAGVANAPAGEVAPGYDDAVPAPINRKLLQGAVCILLLSDHRQLLA